MKVAFSALAVAAAFDDLDSTTMSLENKFNVYKSRFDKTYAYNGENGQDEAIAFNAFVQNDKIIQDHNVGNSSYALGHNEFSDLTWEQFRAGYVGGYSSNPALNRAKNYDYSLLEENTNAPKSMDWVAKGAVNPIKNQGQCGSCWAFSTIASIEGAYQIAGNPLTNFSEQDLVSCDNKRHGGKDQGCGGGLMDSAFEWISKNGICKSQDYPYTSKMGWSGTCKQTCKSAATITGHTDVPGESAMQAALNKGPVSIAIEADKSVFQLYRSGVFDNQGCGKQLDHGVSLVGYGTSSGGKDYYTLRNSWGTSWGNSGYMKIVAGKDMCGLADSASYPNGIKAE